MKAKVLTETVTCPEGASASYDTTARVLSVKGPNGELTRVVYHPTITITIENGSVTFACKKATMREKKQLFTFKSHLKNMLKGVTEGYTYKLKACSGHFPMSVAVKDRTFEVKNFIGEKVPRVLKIKEGADVAVEGQEVTVTGTDKEVVGQVAADIEQLTKRPGFDSRIFQDGIFITEKDGKKI